MLADIQRDALVSDPARQRHDEEAQNQAQEAGVGHGAEGEQGPRPVAKIVETPGERQQGNKAGNQNDGHPP